MNASMNASARGGRAGLDAQSRAYVYAISRDPWVEIVRTMTHGCSRFLTTPAQFHSNRSRLIHGVQFNPFARSSGRQERHRWKSIIVIAPRLPLPSREPLSPLVARRARERRSIRRSIIHILNCQSLLRDCHSDWPRGLGRKGQVGLP